MKRSAINRLVLILVALVLLAAVGAAALLSRPMGNELYESVAMTALQQTDRGVEPDSAFQLTTGYRVKQEQIQSMLRVEPELAYTLKGSGKSWTLKPQVPMEPNMVYTFRILNDAQEVVQSFAFQTYSDLLVGSVYPSDESTYVGTDSAIEFTFNETDVPIEEYFEIQPSVAGTFQIKGYTTTFIPAATLEENSIYRVTLKAGLSAPSGSSLQEDYTFSFETTNSEQDKWDYTRLRLSGDFSETFLPGDTLAVELSSGSDLTAQEFDVKMYQFPDAGAYIKTLNEREDYYAQRYGEIRDYVVDTQGLQQVTDYHGKLLQQGEDNWAPYYAVLPDDTPEGYYIVNISGEDADGNEQFVQKLIQIRNLAVYTQSVGGDTLVWVNDPSSGGALEGISLTLTDRKTGEKQEATTQEDGTARLLTGETERAQLQLLRDGNPIYVEEVFLSKQDEKPALNQQFYTALYTDRAVYQPDDTIRFWGVIRPRNVTSTMPETVYAALSSGWPESDLYKMKVTVGADGTFSGEMKVTGVKKDWYSFYIKDKEDGIYTNTSFEIKDYTKPAYLIEVSTDKPAYFYNEAVNFTVSAHYFDGTPVAGGKLAINGYGMTFGVTGENKQFTLDASGKAAFSGMLDTSAYRDNNGMYNWMPQNMYYTVSNAQEEDVYIYTSGFFYAMPSKVAADVSIDKQSGVLTVKTAQLDSSKVGTDAAARWVNPESSFNQYKGAAVDLPLSVLVHKTEYVQIPIGTYYDEVNKRTMTRYKTDRRESVEKVLNGVTSGGKAVFSEVPFANDETTFYWYEAQFAGGIVGHVSATGYPGRLFSMPDDNENATKYAFIDLAAGSDNARREYVGWGSDQGTAALEEPITLGLYKNGTKVENKGSMLCSAVQSNMLRNTITRDDELTFPMTEEFLPNVSFIGAYFDGRHVYQIENYDVSYNYDSRLLNIEAKAEQQSYRPGDTAKLDVAVTEKATGKPVAASICIGVVDDAVFQVAPQELDLAQQIYQTVFHPNISRSASYKEYNLDEANLATGGRGGGGGDGDLLREDFVDTALFKTLTVDESGKAQLEFTLPDNVTSWRITAMAVTEDLKAGNSTANTVATLPFYLRPLVSDRYLVGDDFAFSVGGVGENVGTEDTVDYTATVLNAAGEEAGQKTAAGTAGVRTAFNFGKLEEGAYTLRLEGTCGENSDAVLLPFSVAKQGMTVTRIDKIALDKLSTLDSVTYPVKLCVYDARLSAFVDGVERLTGQTGARTEVLAAAYRAQTLFNELLPEEERTPVRKDARLDTIQDTNDSDGVKQLPLGEGDAAVTAKLLIAAPELINRGAAQTFLRDVLADAASTPDDRVMAYLGLAASKSPVLLDITRMLKEDASLTTAQKLYLGCGLAELGDFTSAEQIYASIKEAGEVITETNLQYVSGDTNDERLKNTAAALMLTSITSNEDAGAFMRYLNGLEDDRAASYSVLPNLEMLVYLEHFTVPSGEKAGRFSYTVDGETTEETLDIHGFKALSLSAEAFKNAQFQSLSGDLSAAVQHTVYAGDTEVPTTSKLAISKTYTPVDGEYRVSGKVRVDVKVTFSEDAPSGCYQITDLIPSGMRFMPAEGRSNPWYDWCWSYLQNDGQTMRGYLYRDSEAAKRGAEQPEDGGYNTQGGETMVLPSTGDQENEDPNVYVLSYYMSCAVPGEFVAESAYITPYEAGIAAKTERSSITILPNE